MKNWNNIATATRLMMLVSKNFETRHCRYGRSYVFAVGGSIGNQGTQLEANPDTMEASG